MGSLKDEIAKNLLYFRKKRGLTQKELSSKLGVTHNTISSWENGINSIDIEMLSNICSVLDVSIYDMYGDYTSLGNDTFSVKERDIIYKYRLSTDLQTAVDKLLDIE